MKSEPLLSIDVSHLAHQSRFGTVRLCIGAMNRQSQVTYWTKDQERVDIRGTTEEICDHINSMPFSNLG
jgi:hypothetical protein